MEQKPYVNENMETQNAHQMTATDQALETEQAMDMPQLKKQGCKCQHIVIGIVIWLIVASAITLPLTVVWYRLCSFDGIPKFFMCSEGKCLTVKFDVQNKKLRKFNMQEYQYEVKLDQGFEFYGVDSPKNTKGYLSQSFSQHTAQGQAADKLEIYHQAIAFGHDQKITLCDMVGQTLPIKIPLKGNADECNLKVNFEQGQVQRFLADGTILYLAVEDEKDTLVFQTEEFDSWDFYQANKWWDLKEHIQQSWTKNNKAEFQSGGKVYVDQEGGYILCGEYDNHKKRINYCGVLQGHCTANNKCQTGLVCDKIKDSTIFIPKFHQGDNSYCQVEFCKRYGWESDEIKCVECKDGYEGEFCNKSG